MEELSKAKQALFRRLSDKKFRQESGLCAAEGFKCISDCVRFGWIPDWIAVESKQIEQVKPWVAERFPLYLLPDSSLSFLDNPSGMLAVFAIPKPVALAEQGPVVVLDGIQDPGNLGTILRTCHWFGMQHIILLKGTADAFAPKVVQASMGSVAALHIHTLDTSELRDWKDRSQIRFLVAALGGESMLKKQRLDSAQVAWVIGSEGRGVRSEIAEMGDAISIPYFGEIDAPESLNAATALALILGHHFFD